MASVSSGRPDFSRGARELELEARTQQFIREIVIPRERDAERGPGPAAAATRRELQSRARAVGLLAPQVAEAWGGYGLTFRETATVLRASGYSLLGPAAMNCAAPDEGNMHLLEKIANPSQQQQYLKPLAAAEARSAFLMTEPDGAGADPAMMQTAARRDGNHWAISGRKWLITGARDATFGIVMARTPGGASMFLTPMTAPGLRIERDLNFLSEDFSGGHSVIVLEDLRVHQDQVLGQIDEGFRYAQVRLAPARLTHCMRWWGAAKRAHDTALAYACKRQAFGQPLIEHEGVGFMLADNLVDLEQSRLLIDQTAWILDQGGRASTESSMAKYACSEALYRVVDRCVQVLGGRGVTTETPVAEIFREIRAFRIYDGPSEVHKWSLARHLKRHAPQ